MDDGLRFGFAFHRVYEVDHRAMGRRGHAVALAGADNASADGIDFASAAVMQVGIDARQAVRAFFADLTHLGNFLFRIKVQPFARRNGNSLANQRFADRPRIRILRDVAQWHLAKRPSARWPTRW